MNMKRKIFAGLCAFSMAIGAKGGSEKVAAAPIDKVRYGAQAILSTIQTVAFGWIVGKQMKAKYDNPNYRYWGNGGTDSLTIAGVHLAELNGLENLFSSVYDLLKSESGVKRSLNFENFESFDKNKSKPTSVDVKDEQKSNSFVSSKIKYGIQALLSVIQTFIMGWGIYSQVYNKFIRKVHQADGPKKGQPYKYWNENGNLFGEIASHIAFMNSSLNFGSSLYDLLKSEPENRGKSLEVNNKKSEQNSKDKK